MMNDENNLDAELREIDAQLRGALRAPEAPAGLSQRVYDASVGRLRGRGGVIARIGTWRGWQYAAAAVLIGLYVAAWMNPAATEPEGAVSLPDAQVEEMEQAIAGAQMPVDERIDALALEIDELAGTWGAPGNGSLGTDETGLAEELMQIESELF